MSEKIPMKKSELWKRLSDNEGVVVDTVRAVEHTLNDTAMRIFELCDGESTISDIARKITEEYEVDFEKSQQDVAKCIAKLEELNIVTYE
ncbi:MAG: PqqD family protein [Theionarchaea archaeon]|nr:PqqD family protein [Theionarchaea archaeon]